MHLSLSLILIAAVGQDKDVVPTSKGPLSIKPLNHATFVMAWNGKAIYVDPVGGKERFAGQPAPDVVLVTDIHGDHADARTLRAVVTDKTKVVMPKAVAEKLAKEDFKPAGATVLANGEKATLDAIVVEAVPMYNLTAERLQYHDKGRGNGYVVELGGARVYVSGDTEDIPEMRKLAKIDVAFVCMNLPYTMTAEQAASAVLEFKPKVVYPYHSRGQDTEKFKSLVEKGSKEIEVRLRDWYAK
jgi:L-ascorbate metabolism protein UlaG (beta-lactamase superfamily)